ncbi:anti-sigma factor [Quadrisphaera oryzae]|uniref:anti-sigma factor n=1 Tax=Quadrisphaera TaxID=317661 RepID=UPI0016458D0E|nr:anti-sigma factor [Quadrisphaera sp. RL12-1S]
MAPPDPTAAHPGTGELAMLAVAPDDDRLEDVRSHVAACAACTEELAALSAAVAPSADGPARRLPPPSVWEGIAAATGVRSAPDPAAVLRSLDDDAGTPARAGSAGARTVPGVDPVGEPVTARPAGAGRTSSSPSSSSTVVAGLPVQRSRQRWSTPVLLGAAGLALVVGAASGALVASRARDSGGAADPTAGPVVSTAALRPLTADQGAWTGTAQVVVTRDDGRGRRVLVTTSGLPTVQGAAYEVWLLDTSTGGLVSLGALTEGHSPQGGYVLPDGVDLARFSEVDVSTEPLDGQVGHSGVSELRGALTSDAPASTVSA